MRYPYEKYINLLFLKGDNDTNIAGKIRSLKLIPPNSKELINKRDALMSSLPEGASDYLTTEKYNLEKFFKEVETNGDIKPFLDMPLIMSIKRYDAWEDAFLLMVDIDARIIIQTLSLFGYTNAEILQNLKDRLGMEVSEKSLKLFYDFFWDLKGLTRLELYHYIATCSIKKHRELLTDAYHKKAARVKWHMTGVNLLTLEGVLEDVLNTAFEKYKACSDGEDTAANDARTISWANMAVTTAEKLKANAAASNEDTASSIQFELDQLRQDDVFKEEDLKGQVL